MLAEVANVGPVAVIEELNQSMEQAKKCEVMEAELRELDPKHSHQEE